MSKTLVAYFSWSNNTKRAAEAIARATAGDIFEIAPAKAYPASYGATAMKGLAEQIVKANPKIKERVPDLDGYDRIVVGMPIWWYNAPRIICSFLSGYDFSGKEIYPFCTHGGSGPSKSDQALRKACRSGRLHDCIDGNHLTPDSIQQWLQS